MGLHTLGILRVMALLAEFLGDLEELVLMFACVRIVTLEAVLGGGPMDLRSLKSLLLVAGETEFISLGLDQLGEVCRMGCMAG